MLLAPMSRWCNLATDDVNACSKRYLGQSLINHLCNLRVDLEAELIPPAYVGEH